MLKFKQDPESFIVVELARHNIKDSGRYAYYYLIKRDMTTEDAITIIKKKFGVKRINFAGNKDKKAFTFQFISTERKIPEIDEPNIKLKFLGFSDEPITMGKLIGNKFYIKAFSDKKPRDIKFMPNYFDIQRFSTKNIEIGEALIRKDFNKARSLISGDKKDNMAVNDLVKIPRMRLLMYVHSFQSFLFNIVLSKYIELKTDDFRKCRIAGREVFLNNIELENIKIPLVGFATEFNNTTIGKLYLQVMEEFRIKKSDFVIRQIPWLSLEGSYRDAFVDIKDLKISQINFDEWFLEFKLQKGSYATIALKQLFL